MWYYPADVISVRVGGLIRHEGIMTHSGTIISNSRRRGGVYEESPHIFANRGKLINHGPLLDTDPDLVIARAYARIGHKYDPVHYNCEHFVRDCYGLPRSSPQKRAALGAAALIGLIAIL